MYKIIFNVNNYCKRKIIIRFRERYKTKMENERKNTSNENKCEKEDTTKYGEFVSSFFNWNTLKEQKKTANKLQNITENSAKNQSKQKSS